MNSVVVYFDTNIYLDYLLGRKDLTGRDFEKVAFESFNKSLRCDFCIMISDKVLEELYSEIDISDAKILLKMLDSKGKLVKVKVVEEDLEEAKKISPEHYQDALHALTAKRNCATFLATRNIRHFSKYSNLIQAKFPEDI